MGTAVALDGGTMPRPVAHLANLDLNLLVALRELLRERSVTRAAERLGVTQPAASAALSRLRRHFGDELLVRDRGEYTLTALGAQLAEQADAVCSAAQRLFAASADFDPATSEREFTLVMADYTIVVMGEALSQVIARAAPRVRLHIRLVRESLSAEYAEGIRFIDGMVAPPTHGFALPDTRSAELFRDRWVCLVDAHAGAAGRAARRPDGPARTRMPRPAWAHRRGAVVAPPVRGRHRARLAAPPHRGDRPPPVSASGINRVYAGQAFCLFATQGPANLACWAEALPRER